MAMELPTLDADPDAGRVPGADERTDPERVLGTAQVYHDSAAGSKR